MATSTIVVPASAQLEPLEASRQLIAVATAAKADVEGLSAASLAATTPAAVAAAGAAGSAVTASKSDHAHADPNRAAAGTALTDTSTQTLTTPGTGWRKLPLLGQNGALTLGTTGAVAGDQIDVVRSDVHAYTYAVINGGSGAGTLFTFPASKIGCAKFQFDGTDWALRFFGYQP